MDGTCPVVARLTCVDCTNHLCGSSEISRAIAGPRNTDNCTVDPEFCNACTNSSPVPRLPLTLKMKSCS